MEHVCTPGTDKRCRVGVRTGQSKVTAVEVVDLLTPKVTRSLPGHAVKNAVEGRGEFW